jgi:hypothetical protein
MSGRARRRVLLALVPLAALPLLVAATHGARHLTTVSCGQTITVSTTLAADVGPCSDPTTNIFIGAPHVTLNLNGHRIFGTGPGTGDGIFSSSLGVTVENGSVSDFGTDVHLTGDSSRVTNLRVSNAQHDGVDVAGHDDVISSNRVFGNDFYGIDGSGPGSQYANNVLEGNAVAGLSATDAASVSGNKALSNGVSGVRILNPAGAPLTVTNNIADGNHNAGLEESVGGDPTVVTLSGNKAHFNGSYGIGVQPGVTDGGNNRADENGAAAQCLDVLCS